VETSPRCRTEHAGYPNVRTAIDNARVDILGKQTTLTSLGTTQTGAIETSGTITVSTSIFSKMGPRSVGASYRLTFAYLGELFPRPILEQTPQIHG
jgi:hypothetical protein